MDFFQQSQMIRASSNSDKALSAAEFLENKVRQLEASIDQLRMINLAFAELLQSKLGVTEAEINDKIKEIDLRDGIIDGKMTPGVTLCAKCNRRYNARINKCLYCGFSDPAKRTMFDTPT
jgi:hypothetical protein